MIRNLTIAALAAIAAFVPLAAAVATGADPVRPAAFAGCAGCHATKPDEKSFGPNLIGVFGRKAGSLPGYAYSDALKDTSLVWDTHNLDQWLRSPQQVVPGTRMTFRGHADQEKRQQIIDYLKRLK